MAIITDWESNAIVDDDTLAPSAFMAMADQLIRCKKVGCLTVTMQ